MSAELPIWLQTLSAVGGTAGVPSAVLAYVQIRASRRQSRVVEFGDDVREATGLDDEQLADRLGHDEELEELVHRALQAAAQSASAEHRHTLAMIAAHGFTQGPGTHVAELLLTESIVESLLPLDIAALRLLCTTRPVAVAGVPDGLSATGGWTLAEFCQRLPTMTEGTHQALLNRLQVNGLAHVANRHTLGGVAGDHQWGATPLGERLVAVLKNET